MALKILKYPHPALKEISQPVDVKDIGDNFRNTVKEMSELMKSYRGIGLAAIQVGIKNRFFIMLDVIDNDAAKIITLINPEIVEYSGEVMDEEGCLSFPGVSAQVKRAQQVRVKAFNEFGERVEILKEDYLARCIQHEVDHLNGITYFDHLGSLKRKIIEKQYKKLMKKI